MASNDTVNLTFIPYEGEDDVIAWDRATEVVKALETLMNDVVFRLLRQMLEETGESLGRYPKSTALLAASPRKGSILLQLLFSTPDLPAAAAGLLQPGLTEGDYFRQKLATLADATTLLEFARKMIFEDWGILALRTSALRPSIKNDEEAAFAREASASLQELEPTIVNLMDAARRTQCASVKVQCGDGTEILINHSKPKAYSKRLGSLDIKSTNNRMQGKFRRTSGTTIKVQHLDKVYECVPVLGETGSRPVLFLWGSRLDLPPVDTIFEVQARSLRRDELYPLDEVPDEWTTAGGVWLVEKAKPFVDFD